MNGKTVSVYGNIVKVTLAMRGPTGLLLHGSRVVDTIQMLSLGELR